MSNLLIWTSDWHLVSTDTEAGIVGDPTHPTDAGNVSGYIASLAPAGVIDTGDCKDHYGAGSFDEHDRYIEKVRDRLPWFAINGSSRLPILPGNHDELFDYTSGITDFSPFDSKFWGAPYHWTCDWAAPQIRLMGIHSYIHHSTDGYAGFFHVDANEIAWLQSELDALPQGWQAIVCSHAAADPAFGAEIRSNFGGSQLRACLAANQPKIACYLSGHRHKNMMTSVLDGITHFSGPGMSYTLGNGYGGWVPITYDPALRTLIFDFRLGPPSSYDRKAGYTPVVIQLPALAEPPTCATYTFSSDAVLDGVGPLAGSPISLSGTLEVAA